MDNKIKGAKGESLSQSYLINNGYKIVATNEKNMLGEIDIIAKDKDYIVFVEVKYRTTHKFGLPREAVNYAKQKKIRQVATLYLKQKKMLEQNVRFDVIEVDGDKIVHIINAF